MRKLIIITGLPASGKSTLAAYVSAKLNIPLITKDQLKICLLEQLGKKDRSWDIKIGISATRLQMIIAESLLKADISLILESNFKNEYDTPLIAKLIQETSANCFQIICGAQGDILYQRYCDRESSDKSRELLSQDLEEWKIKLQKGFDEPLDLPGAHINIDTSDVSKIDHSFILKEIQNFFLTK